MAEVISATRTRTVNPAVLMRPSRRPAAATTSWTVPRALSAEDTKLVTLARSSRARVGALEGAAVRDQDGRTYAAATVALPRLALTALQLAVASAAAAGRPANGGPR